MENFEKGQFKASPKKLKASGDPSDSLIDPLHLYSHPNKSNSQLTYIVRFGPDAILLSSDPESK